MTENRHQSIAPSVIIAEAESTYHQGNCDRAIDLLVAAGEQLPQEQPIQLKLAELLMDSEQFADALGVLEKVANTPRPDDLAVSMGYCSAALGDIQAAADAAEQALAYNRCNPRAFHLKGIIALHQNDLQGAKDFFEQAIASDPGLGEAYKDLADVQKMVGDSAVALEMLETGFRIVPTRRQVVLAYHSEIVAQSEFSRAEQAFADAIKRQPANQRLLFLYIDILLRRRKISTALTAIQDCIVTFGPNAGLLDAGLQVQAQLEPPQPAQDHMTGRRISLCMIVKDEERHLARCLSSVRGLVDEVIIADTGSSDLTAKIGRVFGARIYPYAWDNDFAGARNFSLSKATGDWILILDADEVIADQDKNQLRSLSGLSGDRRVAYSIMTRNYTVQANLVGWVANDGHYPAEEAGSGWYPSLKVRFFPNDSRIRFSYPIHELVEPSLKEVDIPIAGCQVPVHHYGKLNGQKNDQKALAYYRLGKKKLIELGDNIVALREMAVQAAALERYDEAVDLWQRYVQLAPDSVEAYINMGTAAWQIADYRNAAGYAEKAISLAPRLKEAHFNSALARLYLGDADRAIEILEALLNHHHRYLAARFMLAAAYACTAAEEKARSAFQQIHQQISDFEVKTAVAEVVGRLSSAKLNQYARNLRHFS